MLCLPGSPGAAWLGFVALARPLLRVLHGWTVPVPAFRARQAEFLERPEEDTILVPGVVYDTAAGLEFRRRGEGWPALGILEPSLGRSSRDPHITVELLPRE